jgi:hypothetical protein
MDMLEFEIEEMSRFTSDYSINSLPVNINVVWNSIIKKFSRDLPRIRHEIVPIVPCDAVLKKMINK